METLTTVGELYKSLPEKQAYEVFGKHDFGWSQYSNRGKECKTVNQQLAIYGYRLKDESDDDGYYNDIRTHFNHEIVPIEDDENINFEQKEDILIQNPNDLSYVALCSKGVFRLKINIDGTMQEVALITALKDGYVLKVIEPFSPLVKYCNWVEEAFYHLVPHNPLTKEEQQRVMTYFGEE